MKRIIFSAALILCFCVTFFAQQVSRNQPRVKTEATKDFKVGRDITEIFDVLFYGLGLSYQSPAAESLQFSKSTRQDILAFLKNFPVPYNDIADELSYEKRYRYIQAYYEKYFIVFNLGNEANEWKDKLYSLHFNVTYPDKRIAEGNTKVYEKLKQLYGQHSKTEKFRYSAGEESDINLYIWQRPDVTVTYRSFYDSKDRETVAVVEYWDARFYKSKPYYEL